jgi:hypothetical protein
MGNRLFNSHYGLDAAFNPTDTMKESLVNKIDQSKG